MNLKGVVKIKKIFKLVTGDAAIYDCFSACVDDYKRQLDGGVQSWRALVLLFILPISLYQVFESNLLQEKFLKLGPASALSVLSASASLSPGSDIPEQNW